MPISNSGLCTTDFTTYAAPVAYYNPADRHRKVSGQSVILFARCDAAIPDITDVAAIKAQITAGTIICTPPGIWSLPEPTMNVEVVSGCGEEVEINREYLIPFQTVWIDCEDDDVLFYDKLDGDSSLWRVLPVSCDDQLYVSDAFFQDVKVGGLTTSAGNSAGLEFSFSKSPYEELTDDNTTSVKWRFELKIKKQGLLKRLTIPGISSVCP